MNMTMDDAQLLRAYADDGSEAAFSELVRRHLSLVYHAALRRCGGNQSLAEEATQLVFTDLARKAGNLTGHQTLVGWLFKSVHFASAKLVREAQRRKAREQRAGNLEAIMNEPEDRVLDWEKLKPVVDELLLKLGELDRQALLLRFFEGSGFAEVGRSLGVSEDAARMRVDRALGRLRSMLARKNIKSSGAALTAVLAAQAGASVPPGLAAGVTGGALAAAHASGGLLSAIAFMNTTKVQIGLACLLLAGGGAGVAMQQREIDQLRAEVQGGNAVWGASSDLRLETSRMEKQLALQEQWRSEAEQLPSLRDAVAARKTRLSNQQTARDGKTKSDSAKPVFSMVDLDVKPTVKHQSRPIYPPSIILDNEQGEATISFVVAEDGSVEEADALKSTDDEFGRAAVDAVSLWKFTPGMIKDKAVRVQMRVPIVFRITEDRRKP